jgi:hypothetical protein
MPGDSISCTNKDMQSVPGWGTPCLLRALCTVLETGLRRVGANIDSGQKEGGRSKAYQKSENVARSQEGSVEVKDRVKQDTRRLVRHLYQRDTGTR